MNILDQFERAPSGFFILEVFKGGKLVEVFEEQNLIVDGSKQIHAKLLGGSVANQSLTQIGFGAGTSSPVSGNTGLSAGAFYKAFDSVTYPASNQVRFAFSLGTSEANGIAISEFGLLTPTNVLYARKTRNSPLNKDSDLTLSGTWTISF